jgi:death-on-curing family protein
MHSRPLTAGRSGHDHTIFAGQAHTERILRILDRQDHEGARQSPEVAGGQVSSEPKWIGDGGLDLFDLAAVYLMHIAKGHAFTDGNKRTAYLVALVFLDVNGVHLMQPENETELAAAVVAAAEAQDLNKPDMAALMRQLAARSSRPE